MNNLYNLMALEIELHNQCNRRCDWCILKLYDRGEYYEMEEELFRSLLVQLKYSGISDRKGSIICFNGFYEPLIYPDLLKKRVKVAREYLPDMHMLANTNGDFLTKEAIDGLFLSRLNIMDYDGRGINNQYLSALGVSNLETRNNQVYGTHKDVKTVKYKSEFVKNAQLEDRAGVLNGDMIVNINGESVQMKWKNEHKRRTFPCVEPTYTISVDCKGNVYPCCHFRDCVPEHRNYIFGNLHNDTLENILNSSRFENYRELLRSNDYENFPQPCQYCAAITEYGSI